MGGADALFAVAMMASFVLIAVGARLAWRGTDRKRGLLMITAGLVIAANVAIWTL